MRAFVPLKKEAAGFPVTLVPIYHAKCQYNPKNCNLHCDWFHNTKIGHVMVQVVMSTHRLLTAEAQV